MTVTNATKRAYIATRGLDIPLWAIYNMLPFILLKGLEATPLQLTVAIALKPIVSVLSLYWSAQVNERPDRLRANIILARLFATLPFLILPFWQNCWLMILASALFMTMIVGAIPAWMELLKRELSDGSQKKTFAWGSSLGYLGGGLLPVAFGWLLDQFPAIWQWIFPAAAAISLSAIFFQRQLPRYDGGGGEKLSQRAPFSLFDPLKRAWLLLRRRGDFAKYQLSFMIIGGGLMVMQPAQYLFFNEVLELSYMEFALAISLCKGVSYAMASSLWAKWMGRVDIFRFSAAVTTLACFYPLILMCATLHQAALYLAYILYGVMQAGSEMSWNMSGPIFSKSDDSSLYTGVNVVTVGLRGLIFPALGTLLCTLSSSTAVMLLGSISMLAATAYLTTISSAFARSREGAPS